MAWETVATGTGFDDITPLVGDFQLRSGDQVLVTMDLGLPVGSVFNLAGMELLFQPFRPPSMNIIDIWGEDSRAYVLMQATSPPLAAVLGALPTWAIITIVVAGAAIALSVLVISVAVAVKISQANPNWVSTLAIGGAIVVGGLALMKLISSKKAA